MLHLIVTLFALLEPPAQYRCLTYNGHTECGFYCDATGGELACAKSAAGICATAAGHVTCWDPPEFVVAHYRSRVPRPECMTRGGVTACGYKCVAHDGEVLCADSPDGVCDKTARDAKCWTPAPEVYCAEPGRPLPPARCITNDGQLVCGYGCEQRGFKAGCAATPAGSCIVEKGEVRCFDPPIPTMCEEGKPCPPGVDPRPWCRR